MCHRATNSVVRGVRYGIKKRGTEEKSGQSRSEKKDRKKTIEENGHKGTKAGGKKSRKESRKETGKNDWQDGPLLISFPDGGG